MMSGPLSSPIPRAAPGEIVNVSVNLKSPPDGGEHFGDWLFQNPSGKRFGVNSHGEDFFWVKIRVDWGPGVGPTAAPPPVNCAYEQNSAYITQLLELINAKRAANSLRPLVIQTQLAAAAQGHSADMACNNFMDHTGSDKSSYKDRIKRQGYNASFVSENIYAGGTAADAFDWWIHSKVHLENILSPTATQIGIGHAFYRQSNFGDYYTLDFGKP